MGPKKNVLRKNNLNVVSESKGNTEVQDEKKDVWSQFIEKTENDKETNESSVSVDECIEKNQDRRTYNKNMIDKDESDGRNNEHTSYRGRHIKNTIINFNYSNYRETNVIHNISSSEIIKALIVRAHDDGQTQLCDTLKQTLRAMHLECNFPIVNNSHPSEYNSSYWYPRRYQAKKN